MFENPEDRRDNRMEGGQITELVERAQFQASDAVKVLKRAYRPLKDGPRRREVELALGSLERATELSKRALAEIAPKRIRAAAGERERHAGGAA